MIRAFNDIQARRLLEQGLPVGTPGRIGLPVAGDHAAAKAVVFQRVEALGFDKSWRQQPGSPVYGTDLDAPAARAAPAAAKAERPPELRGA